MSLIKAASVSKDVFYVEQNNSPWKVCEKLFLTVLLFFIIILLFLLCNLAHIC